jgi:hypothetical protein
MSGGLPDGSAACRRAPAGAGRRHGCGTWPSGRAGGEGVEDLRRVGQRRAGIHRDGDPERLGDLLARRTVADGRVGVNGDAAVASNGDGDGEGDELARLRAEQVLHLPGIGVAAYAWLILASWLAFAQGETALTLAVVTVLSLVYFGLLIGGAAVSRDMRPKRSRTRSFRAFLEGDVDTAAGTISGFEALWQVAGMAVSLAVGGTIIILSAVVLR